MVRPAGEAGYMTTSVWSNDRSAPPPCATHPPSADDAQRRLPPAPAGPAPGMRLPAAVAGIDPRRRDKACCGDAQDGQVGAGVTPTSSASTVSPVGRLTRVVVAARPHGAR